MISSLNKTKKINFQEYIYLTLVLAKADFKLKNEGSYLGILWYLLNPLLIFVLLFFIFTDRLGSEILYYPAYLLLGIIMFNFFQQTTIESAQIINKSGHLIKSINFPTSVLISSIILKNIFSHFFEFVVFIIFLATFNISIIGVIFYPFILLLFFMFVFGFSLILSSMTVYFTDLENIWLFIIRLLWFATPIFYTIAGQGKLFILNLFNPIYYYITIARDVVIYTTMPSIWIVVGAISWSIIFFILGLLIFSKLNKKIAELI